ncbi:putative secreted protein (Por secretion system target) [Pontibacter mucosus]|uniref:Putative secreted protein (Por secretion system target) n=1 Tax=Pontibacter mucosus TaxID=1649266 RepID=A0A2T5YHK7_9BACT|nr:putative secreted protein (Por secretion system target) [Pontibacter mucosus]
MKTTFTTACKVAILCFTLLINTSATAQISMGPRINSYSQDFNGLPASGTGVWESGAYYFPGWSVYRSIANSLITANNGSGNTGGLLSYGATGSTERALGSIASLNAGEFMYTLLLQNNTGTAIQAVEVDYTGEQWRLINKSAPQHHLTFWYAISSEITGFDTSFKSNQGWTEVPALKFSGPKYGTDGGALNGNAADNRELLRSVLQIEVPEGHYLMLRWLDKDEKESDHGLAIDDVTVTWHTQPQLMQMPAPLPVELAYFRASASKEHVTLRWQTASEDQNSHFVVERSHDGKLFEGIGMVAGKGTTIVTTNYTYLDLVPLPGTSYYRLKQVDEDETYTYSNIAAVTRSVTQEVAVFPTITSHKLEISSGSGVRQVMVVDAMGRSHLEEQLQSAITKYSLDVSRLERGTYVLVLLDTDGKRHVRRFVKQ